MIHGKPALGVRFNIDRTTFSDYGNECWKIIWRIIDVKRLGGAILFEGDTRATLSNRENVYCIAIQSDDIDLLNDIKSSLGRNNAYLKVAATPAFVENDNVWGEPLPEAGRIDYLGNIVGKAFNSIRALNEVIAEKQQTNQDHWAHGAKKFSEAEEAFIKKQVDTGIENPDFVGYSQWLKNLASMNRASAWIRVAEAFYRIGNKEKAIKCYVEAIYNYRGMADAWDWVDGEKDMDMNIISKSSPRTIEIAEGLHKKYGLIFN